MTVPVYDDSAITVVTPKGTSCATVGQFVVIADSENPFNVRWCAIGDPTDWPTPNTDDARAKQAGAQTMESRFGIVTGIAGGDFFGYVFQERGITKMTYVGGDVVFSFDTFEEGRGCFEKNRYAAVDDKVFFEGEHGYHVVEDGIVQDIGLGFVDRSRPPARSDEQKNVATNTAIGCVFFEGNSLCYNYKTGQWTAVTDYAGRPFFSIADADGIIGHVVKSATFYGYTDQADGVILNATFETGERDLNPDGRTTVLGVRPLIHEVTTTSVAVKIGMRDDLTENSTYTQLSTVNARTGKHDGRVDGRYVRVWYQIGGGFDTVLGADVDFVPSGLV